MLANRHECKYVISERRAADILADLGPFLRPDRHALRHAGYRYPILSLYLDSFDMRLYQQNISGDRNRFKLRLRSYADGDDQPVFVEVKHRLSGLVAKRRAPVSRDVAVAVARGLPLDAHSDGSPALAEFRYLARAVGARPVVSIRYEREAYESTGGDPLRVTFDRALKRRLTSRPDLRLDGPHWDDVPLDGVVLEVKFTGSFPAWIDRMIERFELRRQSMSKYVHALELRVVEAHRVDACAPRTEL